MRVSSSTRRLILLLLTLALAGCGFKLAGESSLPPELGRIQLLASGFSDKQRRTLTARLQQAGAEVSLQPLVGAAQLRVRLKVLPDRRLVTSASNRKIIERVSRSLHYSLEAADGTELAPAASISRQKDIVLDDDELLSATVERDNVVDDLETALFEQLIRQLKRL